MGCIYKIRLAILKYKMDIYIVYLHTKIKMKII